MHHAYIFDVSQGDYMKIDKSRGLACAFKEVLLKGFIPPEAIRKEVLLSDIPMLKDPEVLAFLRAEATSLARFRRACDGAFERRLRQHFDLQVPSVDPERAPTRLRVTRAECQHRCSLCDDWVLGQMIAKSAEHGWVHQECLVRANQRVRKQCRRGVRNRLLQAQGELSDPETLDLWPTHMEHLPRAALQRDRDNYEYRVPILLSPFLP